MLLVNGEIYNHRQLRSQLQSEHVSDSDCEILIHLYQKHGSTPAMLSSVIGMFAFVLYDLKNDTIVVGRDHIGIIPLYMGSSDGLKWFSSELKCLHDVCEHVNIFLKKMFEKKCEHLAKIN